MIIIFPIIGLLVTWKLFKFAKKNEKPYEMTGWDGLEICAICLVILMSAMTFISVCSMVYENITSDIKYEKLETEIGRAHV